MDKQEAHEDFVWCLQICNNGVLASGSSDSNIKFWDT